MPVSIFAKPFVTRMVTWRPEGKGHSTPALCTGKGGFVANWDTLLGKCCYTPIWGNKTNVDRIFVLPVGWNWHEMYLWLLLTEIRHYLGRTFTSMSRGIVPVQNRSLGGHFRTPNLCLSHPLEACCHWNFGARQVHWGSSEDHTSSRLCFVQDGSTGSLHKCSGLDGMDEEFVWNKGWPENH